MRRTFRKIFPVIIVFAILGTGVKWLIGNSGTPPDDRVRAPGESTGDGLGCNTSGCHSSAGVTPNSADISISGLPANYVSGSTYTLTFTIANDVAGNNGFEVAISTGGSSRIGGWGSAGAAAQISGYYWKHSGPTTATSWTINWIAPSNLGTLTFYGVANKGGVAPNGDFHYKTWTSAPVTPLNPFFSVVASTFIQANWTSVSTSTLYTAVLSTASDFSIVTSSSLVASNATNYINLSPATPYYFKVKVSSEPDGAYTNPAISTQTLSGGGGGGPTTRIWNGAGANNLASNGANWVGGAAPLPGDSAIFDGTGGGTKACHWDISGINLSSLTLNTGFSSSVVMLADISISTNLIIVSGRFNPGTSTITFTGTATNNVQITTAGSSVGNIIINKSTGATTRLIAPLDIIGKVEIWNGTLDGANGAGDITYRGDVIQTGGTLFISGPAVSTATFAGSSPQLFKKSGGSLGSLGSIRISNSSVTFALPGTLPSINDNMTIDPGAALNYFGLQFSVGKSWKSLGGVFNANGATIGFYGSGAQDVQGNNFGAILVSNTAGSVAFLSSFTATSFTHSGVGNKLFFNSGSTYTITNLTLNGTGTGTRVQLRGTASSPRYFFNVSVASVSYVDVSSCDASGGVTINAGPGSLDSGNNVNWTFGGGAPTTSLNPVFSSVTVSTISLNWTSVSGSTYTVAFSSVNNFSILSSTGQITSNSTNYFNLASATTYYFKVKLSTESDAVYTTISTKTLGGSVPTGTNLNPTVVEVSLGGIWAQWPNITGNSYVTAVSTTSNFSVLTATGISSLNGNTTSFARLSANTTYYFKIKISTENDAAYTNPAISTVTLPLPAASTTQLAPYYSSVGTSSLTATWMNDMGTYTLLNFDSVDASGGGIKADAYLQQFGITLSSVTGGSSISIIHHMDSYFGAAEIPPSRPNFMTQTGNNNPVSFTMNFANPISSLSFVRPYLIAGPSGIIHPVWSAHALDRFGVQISQVNESQISSFVDVPAQTFVLSGSTPIAAVRFDSDNQNVAAFSAVLIDNISFSGRSYLAVISTASNFSVIQSSSILYSNTTSYTNLPSNSNYYFKVKLSTEGDSSYTSPAISTQTLGGGGGGGTGAISGSITYGGSQTGTFYVAVSSIITQDSFAPILSTTSLGGVGSYSFSNLSSGTYHVWAWRDTNGNGQFNGGEPQGAYGISGAYSNNDFGGEGNFISKNVTVVANSTASNIDINLLDFGTVSGFVTNASTISAPPMSVLFVASPTVIGYPGFFIQRSTGAYTFHIATSAVLYTINAFLDLNSNNKQDPNEPFDAHWATIAIDATHTSTSGVNFVIGTSSSGAGGGGGGSGAITGSIAYGGSQTGTFYVAISSVGPDMGFNDPILSTQSMGGVGSYTFANLSAPGTYYAMAWRDTVSNGALGCGEPQGAYLATDGGSCNFHSKKIFVNAGSTTSNINIDILDFGNVSGFLTNLSTQTGPITFIATHTVSGYPVFKMTGSTGSYTITIASSAANYKIQAFADVNLNYFQDAGEPFGETGATIAINSGNLSVPNVNFALSASSGGGGGSPTYSISGSVSYGGLASKNFKLQLTTMTYGNFPNVAQIALGAGVTTFTFNNIATGTYYLRGYNDSNSDNLYQADEPTGQAGTFSSPDPISVISGNVGGIIVKMFDRKKILPGQTLAGVITSTGTLALERGTSYYGEWLTFFANAGQQIQADETAVGFSDTYLYLFAPDGHLITFNDDVNPGVNTNSRIITTIANSGDHHLLAATFGVGVIGSYNMALSFTGGGGSDVPGNVRFYQVNATSITAMWDSIATSSYTVMISSDFFFNGAFPQSLAMGVNSSTFTGLIASTQYYFKVKITTQPDTAYSAPVSTITKNLGAGFGQISGSINYGGGAPGPFIVRLSTVNYDVGMNPIFAGTIEQNIGGVSTFSFTNLPDGTYYLRAYKDTGPAGWQKGLDPSGVNNAYGFDPAPIGIAGGSFQGGKVIDVYDVKELGAGQTFSDALISTGPIAKMRGSNYNAKVFAFFGNSNQQITIDLIAQGSNWDSYLYLLDESGLILFSDDNSGGSLNARISNYTLTKTGMYFLVATSFGTNVTGAFNITANSSGGAAQFSGTISHNHAGIGGPYRIEVSQNSMFNPITVSSVVAPGAGTSTSYTIGGLTAGNTYYVRAFIDLNLNGVLDPTEPVSTLGNGSFPQPPFGTHWMDEHISVYDQFYATSSIGGMVNAQIFVTTTPITGANIYTEDRGAISGYISQSSTQTGQIVLWAARDTTPTSGINSNNPDNRNFNHRDLIMPSLGSYSFGSLRPGVYTVRAFIDNNYNQNQDTFEDFGSSFTVVVASDIVTSSANILIAGAQAPPPPLNFMGVALSTSQIKWSWTDVNGESGYQLRDSSGAILYSLPADSTYYVEMNVSGFAGAPGQVRGVTSFNSNGASPASTSSVVYTMVNAAGTPSFGAVGFSTIAVSWPSNNNHTSAIYDLYRAAVTTANYVIVLSTSSTSVIDSGLVPQTTYYYRVKAGNGNAVYAAFSSANSAVTTPAPGSLGSISGTLTYSGSQPGNILLQIATDPGFTTGLYFMTLPNISSQSFYISQDNSGNLVTGTTHYLRAFVDVNAAGSKFPNNILDAGEDTGVFGGATALPILVSGAVTGKNFSINADVTAPNAPFNLSGTFAGTMINLNWSAPNNNADGTVLNDLWGYEVERSVEGSAFAIVTDTNTPISSPSASIAAASGMNTFRVRAADWGKNKSLYSGTFQISVATVGSITGTVDYKGNAGPGNFRIMLSTSSDPKVAPLQTATISAGNTFIFNSVTNGTYYLRGFKDTMGPFNVWQSTGEPAGADGPFANPFPITITGAQNITGRVITIADRKLIAAGQTIHDSIENQTIVSTQPVAQERGPNYFGKYFTFNGAQGQQVTISLIAQADSNPNINQTNPNWDTYLYLIGPGGGILIQDDDGAGSGNARITNYTLPAAGVYHILATSFGLNVTGSFNLTLQTVGGYAGGISGTVTYNGIASGAMRVTLHQGTDPNAPAVQFGTATLVDASHYSYSFNQITDGSYFVRAFKDTNGNGFKDPSEPFGETPILTVAGSALTQNLEVIDALSISGNVSYTGSPVGQLIITLLQSGQQKALLTFPSPVFPQSYNIKVSTPGTYDLQAFLDSNLSNHLDLLEPFGSTNSIALTSSLKDITGVNMTLGNVGAGDPTKNLGSITGKLSYTGTAAPSGAVKVLFATDIQFNNVVYATGIASQGTTFTNVSYVSTGMAAGTTYYVAAFRDKNNNGIFDEAGGEPAGGFGLVNYNWNSLQPIVVGSTEMGNVNINILDPTTGTISGTISYFGTRTGSIIINVNVPNSGGPGYYGSTVIAQVLGQSSYAYQINYLASSPNFVVNAFVDSNGDGAANFGEPFVSISNVNVSTMGAATTGQNITLLDPGAFGGGTQGQISGIVTSSGTRTGSMRVELHLNSDFSDYPLYTAVGTSLGISSYSFTLSNINLNTYYVRAFKDGNNNLLIDPGFEENGKYGAPTGITLTSTNLFVSGVNFQTYDPGVSTTTVTIVGNTISGSVFNRSGITAGRLVIELMTTGATLNIAPTRSVSFTTFASTQTYSFSDVPNGNYFVRAFIDTDSNFVPGPTEPSGRRAIGFYSGGGLSSQDFDLAAVTSIIPGVDTFGALSYTDAHSADRGTGAFADIYSFQANRGDVVTIEMDAQTFQDTYLYLLGPSGEIVTQDDDSAGALNAKIANYSVNEAGLQKIVAASYGGNVTGNYKLRLDVSGGGAGSIAGNVTYSGSQGGRISVGLFDQPPGPGSMPINHIELPGATSYIFTNVISSRSYYIGAFIDVNNNFLPDPQEPKGFYGTGGVPQSVFVNQNQNVNGINFEIADSSQSFVAQNQMGLMTGQISFTGTQSGPVNVEVWTSPTFNGTPVANRRIDPFTSPASWDVRVPAGSYYVKAWMDANNNFMFDPQGDPQGVYSLSGYGADQVYVTAASTATSVNVTLRAPNQVLIGGVVSTTTYAGEGSAAIVPSTVPAGQQFSSTISVIIGTDGIGTMGKVSVRWPTDTGLFSPFFIGTVGIGNAPSVAGDAYVFISSAASLFQSATDYMIDNQFGTIVLRKISGNLLTSGSTVQFVWNRGFAGCQSGTQTFTVATISGDGIPQPIATGQPQLQIRGGVPQNVTLGDGWLTMPQGSTGTESNPTTHDFTSLVVQLRDSCFNVVRATSPIVITASATRFNSLTYQQESDNTLFFTTSTFTSGGVTFATGPWLSVLSFAIPVNRSSATLYMIATSGGNKNIRAFNNFTSFQSFSGLTVTGGNLSNVSISTNSAPNPGNTVVTINPSAAIGNSAFIRFNPGDPTVNWRVAIASAPWPSADDVSRGRTLPTAIWETGGFGIPQYPIVWDGRFAPWINFGAIVPTGLYYIRVELIGSSIRNDSLQVSVAVPTLNGNVSDSVNPLIKLPDVLVQASGPDYAQAFTNSVGTYSISGLSAGTYFVRFSKSGYLDKTTTTVLGANGGSLSVSLDQASSLRIFGAISSTSAFEQWGSITVVKRNNTGEHDWTNSYFASLHVAAGTTTIDDGGRWDPSLQQFLTQNRIKIDITPGNTYFIDATMFGFGTISTQTFIGTGVTNFTLPLFSRKANVSGSVILPSTSTSGSWVSIEARPMQNTLSHNFSGAFIPTGSSSQSYTLFGMDAGNYTLIARAQGFNDVQTTIAVGSTDMFGVDIPTFTAGVSLAGRFVVKGSSSFLVSIAEKARASGQPITQYISSGIPGSISLWDPLTAQRTQSTSILIDTSAVAGVAGVAVASGTYRLDGVVPGNYQYFSWFYNFGSFILSTGTPQSITVTNSTQTQTAPDIIFEQATGGARGSIRITQGNSDFQNVIMQIPVTDADIREAQLTGQTIDLNKVSVQVSTTLENYQHDPGASTATFRSLNSRVQQMDVTMVYLTNGVSARRRVTITKDNELDLGEIDLSGQSYSITGTIEDGITDSRFNTVSSLISVADRTDDGTALGGFGANRFFTLSGYPLNLSSTTARVEALKREIDNAQTSIANLQQFDSARTRVGFITAAGTYTINGITPGVWSVYTFDLKDSSSNLVAPRQEKTIVVTNSSTVNFRLSGGFTVSGAISISDSKQDARNLLILVKNRKGDVVAVSSNTTIGNPATGVTANSVNYSFAGLPSGQIYTIQVFDRSAPIKYLARPLQVPSPTVDPTGLGLQGNLSNQNISFVEAGAVKAKLRDANSGTVISLRNKSILAPNFRIFAIANPWTDGGFTEARSTNSILVTTSALVVRDLIGEDGTITLGPLIPGIPYDIHFEQPSWSLDFVAQGAQNFTPIILAGVIVNQGEIKDFGIQDLNQGTALTGSIRDGANAPLSNIRIVAKPALVETDLFAEARSDINGQFRLWVSSFVSRFYDVTAAPRQENETTLDQGSSLFAEKTIRLDLGRQTTVAFNLVPANFNVTGNVTTNDNGQLLIPFGDNLNFPGAAVVMQPVGVPVKGKNPLGDIVAFTNATGTFTIPRLSAGTYLLRAASIGYAVRTTTVTITDSSPASISVTSSDLILARGASVTGTIRKPDASAASGFGPVSQSEVASVAATDRAFNEFVFGTVEIDPIAKTISKYTVTGFKTNKVYTMVLLPENETDDIVFPEEGYDNVSFSSDESTATKTINLTYKPVVADVFATAKKVGQNIQIKFKTTRPLRNRLGTDNDLSAIITLSAVTSTGSALVAPDGGGTFLTTSGSSRTISDNRKELTAVYSPATGESKFSVRFKAFTNVQNPATGDNFQIDKTFDLFIGLDGEKRQKISNARGGNIEFEGSDNETENTGVSFDAGTFVNDGDLNPNPTSQITCGIARAQDVNQSTKTARNRGAPGFGNVQDGPDNSLNALPPVLGRAIAAMRQVNQQQASQQSAPNGLKGAAANASQVASNVLGKFYDIFLPQGVKRALAKNAKITLQYSTATADLANMNVYFYNDTNSTMTTTDGQSVPPGAYGKEITNRKVDEINKTISVSVNHFTVFIIVNATSPTLGGNNTSVTIANVTASTSTSSTTTSSPFTKGQVNIINLIVGATVTVPGIPMSNGKDEQHSFTCISTGTNGAGIVMNVQSQLQQHIVALGEERLLDLDGDGLKDLSMKVLNINGNVIMLSLGGVITQTDTLDYTGTEIQAFNFPNPFNPNKSFLITASKTAIQGSLFGTGTKIRYALPSSLGAGPVRVSLQIYDVEGELVRRIDFGSQPTGKYGYGDWDGKNEDGQTVASGVYIGRLVIDGSSRSKIFKMAVVK